jgi:hypothetical protein
MNRKPQIKLLNGIWCCGGPSFGGWAYGRGDGFPAIVDAYETWALMTNDGMAKGPVAKTTFVMQFPAQTAH